MHRLILSLVLTAIIALAAFGSQAALAATDRESVVFVVDRYALSQTPDGVDAAKSVIGLVSTLRPDSAFTFVGVDDPAGGVGPMLATDESYTAFQGSLNGWLLAPGAPEDVDALGAVSEIAEFLDTTVAAQGSTIYLVTGELDGRQLIQSSASPDSLAAALLVNGWRYVSVGLPGPAVEQGGVLAGVAARLGGEHYDLSALDGYRALTNSVLRMAGKPALEGLGGGALSSADSLSLDVAVAPGTEELSLFAFKQSAGGRVTLITPSGSVRTTGDGVSSFLLETANAVMWRIVEPEPGDWQMDVRGVDGAATAWSYNVNVYKPVLSPLGTTPLNEPAVLTASVERDRQIVMAEGAQLAASIRTPDGKTLRFDLNDDGVSGDVTAGDGYFSAAIPPLLVEGRYSVELELTWPGIDRRISSQGEFRALAFPSLDVSMTRADGLKPGLRAKIGEANVHVLGQPYAIAPHELSGEVAADTPGTLEIEAREWVSEGRASDYDLFFTAQGETRHTLDLRLNLEYDGRQYSYITDSFVISSVQAAAPVVQQMPPSSAPPTAPTGPTPEQPPPAPGDYRGLLAIPAVILAAIIGATVYWLTRRSPYGYIFDDQGRMVVDFASLHRAGRLKLFSKDAVSGAETSIKGLEGVAFTFSKRGVGLQNREMARNVRVNNLPLIGETDIRHETLIGTEGRLYNFMLSPTPPQPMGGPAGGDGD